MRKRIWSKLLAVALACATVSAPLASDAGQGRGKKRGAEESAVVTRQQENPTRGRSNTSRVYQDAASRKGYESGRDLGLADGRDGERYDPVRHRDYRDGDRGYAPSYGSRDGYETKFRAGFRQGYEDGYREGARARK